MIEIILAGMLAIAPKEQAVPQCETREIIERSARENNATPVLVMRDEEARRFQRRLVEILRQDYFPVDLIVLYENPNFPNITFIVAFNEGCAVAAAPFPRGIIQQLRSGI